MIISTKVTAEILAGLREKYALQYPILILQSKKKADKAT